jgi:hypothetical protein
MIVSPSDMPTTTRPFRVSPYASFITRKLSVNFTDTSLCLGRAATRTSIYQHFNNTGHEYCFTLAESAGGTSFVRKADNSC